MAACFIQSFVVCYYHSSGSDCPRFWRMLFRNPDLVLGVCVTLYPCSQAWGKDGGRQCALLACISLCVCVCVSPWVHTRFSLYVCVYVCIHEFIPDFLILIQYHKFPASFFPFSLFVILIFNSGKGSVKKNIYVAESLCSIPETNTTLQINYTSI